MFRRNIQKLPKDTLQRPLQHIQSPYTHLLPYKLPNLLKFVQLALLPLRILSTNQAYLPTKPTPIHPPHHAVKQLRTLLHSPTCRPHLRISQRSPYRRRKSLTYMRRQLSKFPHHRRNAPAQDPRGIRTPYTTTQEKLSHANQMPAPAPFVTGAFNMTGPADGSWIPVHLILHHQIIQHHQSLFTLAALRASFHGGLGKSMEDVR